MLIEAAKRRKTTRFLWACHAEEGSDGDARKAELAATEIFKLSLIGSLNEMLRD